MKKLHDTKTLTLNQKTLTLQIIRSSARKRSLAIMMHSSQEISIRAPLRTSLKTIDEFITSHQPWLIKKISEFEQRALLKQEQLAFIDHTEYSSAQILAKFTDRAIFWALQLKVEFSKICLSRATGRWGSCSAENVIRINAALIKAPLELLDYVIVHELCHVRHKNHSAYFWRFVASVMPDYRERRKSLNALGFLLQGELDATTS